MNKLPDLKTEAGRTELAQWLARCIEAGERQRGGLPDRWERLEAMAKQIPTDEGSNYDETNVPRTFPLMSPKIDQLVGAVCGPVLSRSPYFTAKGYGASTPKAEKGSEVNQFLLERTGFDRLFRNLVRMAIKAEPSIAFCYFDEAYESGGIAVDVIHPRDFIIYPAYKGGIKKALVCGDRYYERLADIQGNKRYFDEREKVGTGSEPDTKGYESPSKAAPFDALLDADKAIECWRLVAKIGEDRFLCRVARQNKVLLSCEPYGATVQGLLGSKFMPYTRPGYFDCYLQEVEGNEFLREVPVAHKMQGLQLVFDKLLNSMVDGTEMSATPPIIATGAIGDAGKLVEYEPNSIISMPGDVKLTPVPTAFNPGQMPQLITLMSELADAASRVSQAGQGQQFSGSPTATEVAGVLDGQKMGLDEYRMNACQGPSEMSEFNIELAQLHFANMIERYGEDFPAQSIAEFAGYYTFEPTGKTIESTPGALIEKVKLAMSMAQQMVSVGLLPPQLLLEFFRLLIDTLDLPIEDHVIQQFIGVGAGAPVLPGAGMGVPQGAVPGGMQGAPAVGGNPGPSGQPGGGMPVPGQVGNPPVPNF